MTQKFKKRQSSKKQVSKNFSPQTLIILARLFVDIEKLEYRAK